MKLALFDDYVPGLVVGDEVIDLSAAVGNAIMAIPGIYRMNEIIANFDSLRDAILQTQGPKRPLAGLRLRAPQPRPSKIIVIGTNYREGVAAVPTPLRLGGLFSPSAILDPGGTVVLPKFDAFIFHHEAELTFIVGKRGRDIPAAKAMDYVFGYTCGVDVSARNPAGDADMLRHKCFDTFKPIGPWIATRDEIPDPYNLQIRLWVDGQLRPDYNTSDMEHHIPELIAAVSEICTLEPGDIFFCGTNHQGLGPMQDGEKIVMEIDHIGRLEFDVRDPLKRRWPVGIDRGVGAAVRRLKLGEKVPLDDFFTTKRIA